MPLAIEDVARYPLPGAAAPSGFAYSPDGRLLTFLAPQPGSLTRELHAIELSSGQRRVLLGAEGGGVREENLTLEEQLRRERARDLSLGVTSYAWAAEAPVLAVPLPDGVHVGDGDGSFRLLVSSEKGPVLDPRLSPDGSMLAFVQGDELHVVPTDGSAPPRAVTSGATGAGVTHGLAEFVAQEEMGRAEGFWWSRDGMRLAFTEVDERHIPVYRIVHQGKDVVGEAAQEDHRYPFAGAANARVRLGVVGVDGGEPVWMDLGPDDDVYLARVTWSTDGTLLAQVEDRRQLRLDVIRLDPTTGGRTVLLAETSDVWVNLHDHLRPLRDGRFLWASERTGFLHLEVRAADGSLERVLTEGDWIVTSVDAVDEDAGLLWCTTTEVSPMARHLRRVRLDGGGGARMTDEAGVHAFVVDPLSATFVDVGGTRAEPSRAVVRSLHDGSERVVIDVPEDPRVAQLGLVPPELVTIPTNDGVELHAAVYRPEGEGPFPLVLSVYGGPHAQRALDAWSVTVSMRAQYLRQLGFLVVAADNRGGAGRGLAFEAPIRHDLGDVEVRDQVAVVRHFVDVGLADPARVGVYGWSYGGYLSAMCLARAPETFRVAVAGAPVTHWDGYDTHYTERYMGLPAENAEGYERSSVMHHVGAIVGRLLLVHGLIDENVHFRHTARLVNALIRARKPYELLLFPDERHSPRSEADRVYMEERIVATLCDALGVA